MNEASPNTDRRSNVTQSVYERESKMMDESIEVLEVIEPELTIPMNEASPITDHKSNDTSSVYESGSKMMEESIELLEIIELEREEE